MFNIDNFELYFRFFTIVHWVYILCIHDFVIIIIIYSLEFFRSALADGFPSSLSDSKPPQVSRTLLSILAVLNNVVVYIVSTHLPTSKSSSPFSKPFVTVPNIPITIGIIITCMFHSFFQCPSKVEVLILLFTLFQFYSVVSRDNKIDNFASSLFLLLLLLLGLVFWPRFGELCVCQSPIGVYVCNFLGQVLDCAYTICLHGQI